MRSENGITYSQTYNSENRISEIKVVSGSCAEQGEPVGPSWEFTYDRDGNKVKQIYTTDSVTTTTYTYAGGSYEIEVVGSQTTTTQYYSIGGVSVGMKQVENQIPTLSYFLTDHLGSVVGMVSENGTLISETRYSPFGEVRTDVGEIGSSDYGFTFQKVESGSGLMDYKGRMYDFFTGRFIQSDTLVPEPGRLEYLSP